MSYHNNPRIVTDGLVLCLDANNKKSAPSEDLPVKSGCVTWLDGADDSVFIYSSGTLVSEWRDKSGNDNHVYQSTTASQPTRNTTYHASGSNLKDVVVFDGTDDSLSSTNSLNLSAGYTMFVLVRGYTSSSDAGVISINNSLQHGITIHNGSLAYFYFGGGGINTTQSITTSETNILTKRFTGNLTYDNRISYKNGTIGYSTGVMRTDDSTGVLRLGQQSTYLNGLIGEVIIYNRDLDTAELNKVHGYLSNKWGNTVSGDSWFDLISNDDVQVNGAICRDEGYFDFDGTDDYIRKESVSSNIATTGNQSFEVWCSPDITSGTQCVFGFSRGTGPGYTTNGGFWVTGGVYRFTHYDGSAYIHQTILAAAAGTPVYLAATFDGDKFRYYHNGVLKATSASTNIYNNSLPDGIDIGSHRDGVQENFFNGKIYTCRFYKDNVLSSSEILQNYEAHKSRFGL
jgi:hypothetical protein